MLQEKFDIFSTLLIHENVFKALGRIKTKKSVLVLILHVLVLVLHVLVLILLFGFVILVLFLVL